MITEQRVPSKQDQEVTGEVEAPAPPARGRSRRMNLIVLGAILAALLFWVDLRTVGASLLALSPAAVLAALLLATLDRLLMAYKWRQLIQAVGGRLRLRDAVSIYYQAGVSSRVLPVALGSDLFRAYLADRFGVPTGIVLGSIVLEKLLGMVASGFLAVLGLVYLLARMGAELPVLSVQLVGAVLLGSIGALLVLFHLPAHRFAALLLGPRLPLPLKRPLQKFSHALHLYRERPRALAIHQLLVVGEQLLQYLKLFVLARALGVALPLVPFFATVAVVVFARRLTGSIESWGLAEVVGVITFALFGISEELAVALAIANFALTTVAILPGLFPIYRSGLLPRGGRRGEAQHTC